MGPQGVEFHRLILARVHDRCDQRVIHQEGGILRVDVPFDRLPMLGGHRLHGSQHDAPRNCRPVDLGDLPRLPQIRAETRGGGEDGCVAGDAMGLDVIGVAVAAEVVVRDHHLRTDLADHLDQVSGGLEQIRTPEAVRAVIRRSTDHAAVAVAAIAAEAPVIGNAKDLHSRGQFGESVRTEGVVVFGRQVRQLRQQHLAFFPQGARHQRDVYTCSGIGGHGAAGGERLVVWMRVNEEQSLVSGGLVHEHRL